MFAIETTHALQNEFQAIKDNEDFSGQFAFLNKLNKSNEQKYLDFHYELLKEGAINRDYFSY